MVVGFVSRHCWYCCPCGVSEPFTVPTLVRGYTYNPMESTKKLIKIKKYMLVHQAKSSLLKQIRRTAHCVIESLIALDGQSLQLETGRSWVPFLGSLLCTQLFLISISVSSHGLFFNIFFIFSFVYCYYFTCFKTVIFSCGPPINGFWLSGVSREIKNYLILLLNREQRNRLCCPGGGRFR